MGWLLKFFAILTAATFTNGFVLNENYAHEKRQAPGGLDLAALAANPTVAGGQAKIAALMQNPKVQAILADPRVQNILKPENMKKILDSGAIPKLLTMENIKKFLASPTGQKIAADEKIKGFIASDAFGTYVTKLQEALPKILETLKKRVDAQLGAQPPAAG